MPLVLAGAAALAGLLAVGLTVAGRSEGELETQAAVPDSDADRRLTGMTVRQPPPQQDFWAPRKGGPKAASAATRPASQPAPPVAQPGGAPTGFQRVNPHMEFALDANDTRGLRNHFRDTPTATLHAFAQQRYKGLRVMEVDVPGGKAVEVRNPESAGQSTGLYLGVDVSGMRWWFQCLTDSAASSAPVRT